MKKLIIKSFMITSLFLLIILMIIYNFISNPLYKILEETILENYVNIGESSKKTFENTVTRGLENAKSISSRTMIRRKLTQYRAGIVELEELKDYTQGKYNDGMKALDNVIYGVRVAEGKIIAEYREKPDEIDIFKQTENLSYELFNEDEKTFLLIYSPIKSYELIGMDIIIFDLSGELVKIKLPDMLIDIVGENEMLKHQETFTINPLISESKDSNNNVNLNIFYEIDEASFLHISMPKDNFYSEFNNITKKSLTNLTILFIFSFISMNTIIIAFASQKITVLDRSYKKHKLQSYKDTLTGAYSRFYLEEWLRENSGKKIKYTIVFLDMNNFKAINDRYGHKKGDEVLKDVVTIFKNEIREDDLVIRFGGDEFILLLDCDSKERGSYILDRINEKLKALISLDIEVSFAYGIEELNNTNEFHDILEKIDIEMYKMKNEKRN